MVGRRLEQMYPRSVRVPGDVVLDVRELSAVPKPLDASFALRRGEILGLAGLVGAGRTELLRALFGLAPIARGDIRLFASPRLGPSAGTLEAGRGNGE